MGLILFLLFGFVVGLLARAILPGRQHMGIALTTVLGVAGSFIGGLVANLIGHRPAGEANTAGLIGSVIGAIVLLAIVQAVQRRRIGAGPRPV